MKCKQANLKDCSFFLKTDPIAFFFYLFHQQEELKALVDLREKYAWSA